MHVLVERRSNPLLRPNFDEIQLRRVELAIGAILAKTNVKDGMHKENREKSGNPTDKEITCRDGLSNRCIECGPSSRTPSEDAFDRSSQTSKAEKEEIFSCSTARARIAEEDPRVVPLLASKMESHVGSMAIEEIDFRSLIKLSQND